MLEFVVEFSKLDTYIKVASLVAVLVTLGLILCFLFFPITRALYAVSREIRLLRTGGKEDTPNA